jgi:hemoglobin
MDLDVPAEERRPAAASWTTVALGRRAPRAPDPVHDRDLDTRTEIHDMVVAFYRELAMDPALGRIFEQVAEVDWAEHIPRLVDYWCRVLLGDPTYQGAILQAHQRVHDLERFEPAHFIRWYELFVTVIDDGWSGPFTDEAKAHAGKIAGSLARHLGVAPAAEPRLRSGG